MPRFDFVFSLLYFVSLPFLTPSPKHFNLLYSEGKKSLNIAELTWKVQEKSLELEQMWPMSVWTVKGDSLKCDIVVLLFSIEYGNFNFLWSGLLWKVVFIKQWFIPSCKNSAEREDHNNCSVYKCQGKEWFSLSQRLLIFSLHVVSPT